MTWTYDPSSGTNLAKVRLLTTDTDVSRPIMTDEDIAMFLGLAADEPMIAAAMALDNIAANEALCSKAVNILGLTVDGPGVAKALRFAAKQLREDYQTYANANSPGFVTIEFADDYLQQNEKLLKEYERGNLA